MSTERYVKAFTMIVVCAFNIAASVMLVLTLLKLKQVFAGKRREIQLGTEDRKDMDTTEIIFICVVTFMAVTSVAIYLDGNQLFNSIYSLLTTIYDNGFSLFLRLVLPILALGVGSALYNKIMLAPNGVCDLEISSKGEVAETEFNKFRTNFLNTYWLLFGVFMLFITKYLADSWIIPLLYSRNWIDSMNPGFNIPSLAGINHLVTYVLTGIISLITGFKLGKDETQKYVGGMFVTFICIFIPALLFLANR
jgi:hypothetical protein